MEKILLKIASERAANVNNLVGTSRCEKADKCRRDVKITSANVTLLCHVNSARFQC
jgi:hypothetical protein